MDSKSHFVSSFFEFVKLAESWSLKKKKKSRFQKIQELRLKVKLFKMSKVFGIEAGVTFS